MQAQQNGGRQTAPLFLRLVTPVFRAGWIARLHPAPKTAFILSTGRTGTVYLADLLNQLDGVISVHEPKPSRVLNAWTTAYLEGHVSTSFMATVLAKKRHKALKDLQVDLYAESNNFIAGFADALDQVFENPTIIHLVRDPRDFATSLTNRGDDTGIRRLFNLFVPFWAYVPKELKKRELTRLTRPAYRWVAINEYLSNYGRGKVNYHFFKFEDVFDKKNPAELKRLLAACGLSAKQIATLDFAATTKTEHPKLSLLDRPSSSQNASKYDTMPKWRDWSSADAQAYEAICGEFMKRYGYGNEPEWRRLLKDN